MLYTGSGRTAPHVLSFKNLGWRWNIYLGHFICMAKGKIRTSRYTMALQISAWMWSHSIGQSPMCVGQESVFHTVGTANAIEMDGNYDLVSKRRSKIFGTLIQAFIILFSFYFTHCHTHLVRYSKVACQMINILERNWKAGGVEFLRNTWLSKLNNILWLHKNLLFLLSW